MPSWVVHRHNEGDCATPSFYRQPPIQGAITLLHPQGGCRHPNPHDNQQGQHHPIPQAPCFHHPRTLVPAGGHAASLHALGEPLMRHPGRSGITPPFRFCHIHLSRPLGPFVFRCRYSTSTGPGCQAGQRKIVVIKCNTRSNQSPPINPGASPIPIHHPAIHGPPTPRHGPPCPIAHEHRPRTPTRHGPSHHQADHHPHDTTTSSITHNLSTPPMRTWPWCRGLPQWGSGAGGGDAWRVPPVGGGGCEGAGRGKLTYFEKGHSPPPHFAATFLYMPGITF